MPVFAVVRVQEVKAIHARKLGECLLARGVSPRGRQWPIGDAPAHSPGLTPRRDLVVVANA
jgi:hypothetical protein